MLYMYVDRYGYYIKKVIDKGFYELLFGFSFVCSFDFLRFV